MRSPLPTVFLLAALTTAPAGAQPIQLEAATDRGLYAARVDNEVYVQARVRTAASADSAATASTARDDGLVRNVAFVVDHSGSMAGESIEAAREAVGAAIDRLAGDDIVSVVLFGSEVETLVEAQRRDRVDLRARMARTGPAGGSALYDALNQAAAQLRRHAGPSTIDHLVLITDGPPTKGPREPEDFASLAAVFAGEGLTLSTIGLGEEFDEDLLSTLARLGHGRFRFVVAPGGLAGALEAEIAPLGQVAGREAVLSIEFRGYCREVTGHGRGAAAVEGRTVTWRFPWLYAGQDLNVLASAEINAITADGIARDFATVRLQWRGIGDDEMREQVQPLSLRFVTESWLIRESIDPAVYRSAVGARVSEALQDAIDELDTGDARRAVRVLRRAREQVRDANFRLDDPGIAAMAERLDAYLNEVEARGVGPLDRKILRSGLFDAFEPPPVEAGAAESRKKN